MDHTTYTNFRQNLKSFMDRVMNDRIPLLVTRAHGQDVVVLSKADFDSIHETFYLLKNPRNAQRIFESLSELRDGGGFEKSIQKP
ncbi:type II toxin-antitoxin system prevent-host-death family antitoxin [Reichenbachiella agarivorans]|uniref:Antitoxin n=1 Tax=Reichenbachiella agarivorans TaxID=2979464 RepID=A0ABY6CPY0_9BACT|nr:type II toxin-antitoxin system prevent-host-death family antitoxin [Reichenbachiella agarivorans]UXP31493.1 type II toxin-antitoxin system prevent-host-death family antitoxin [Reichenbachiella agarivorans]